MAKFFGNGSACPCGHSVLYCNGYHAGYIDLWNHWIYNQEYRINFVNTSQRRQQVCSIINSPGAICMQSQQSIQQVKSHNMKLISNKQLSSLTTIAIVIGTGRIFVLQYFAKLSMLRSCSNLSSRNVLSPFR
jgi:hypothetical protein